MSRGARRPSSMSTIGRTLVAGAGLSLAAGCAGGFEYVQSESRVRLFRLEAGMPADSVRAVMGTEPMKYDRGIFQAGEIPNPWDEESHVIRGESVDILYYVTHVREPDGRIADDELTPLVLVQGRLAGWGWPFLDAFAERTGLVRTGPRPP
ncbi:MAG: DUF3192 domain-containing protein, partial [Gemmatimonadota bacterium]|nr:DUF3192 domain-containing protein [Gemmatimonadota bacterium]